MTMNMTMTISMTMTMTIYKAKTKKTLYYIKMEETKPSTPLFYTNFNSSSEQNMNDKILANEKLNNSTNIINILENIMKLKLIAILRS